MQKFLLALAAFVVSAVLGVGLLVIAASVIILTHLAHYHHPGIGAIAGGIPSSAVLIVPLLCGIIGAYLAVRRVNRPSA